MFMLSIRGGGMEVIMKRNFERKCIKSAKRFLGITMAAAVIITSVMAAGSTDADAKKKKKNKSTPEPTVAAVDLGGVYHAALGIQTDTKEWMYRIGYYHDEYAGTDEWKHLATGAYGSDDYKKIEGTFTDVEIKGNGTYTVSLDNADYMGETHFSQMQVATDIPDTGEIKFSDMIVTVDGLEKGRFEDPYIDKDSYAGGNCCLLAINNWRPELQGINGECVPTGSTNNISITFTVSGFNYDNEEQAATPEPADIQTTAPSAQDDDTEKDAETSPVLIISIIVIAVAAIMVITFRVGNRKR